MAMGRLADPAAGIIDMVGGGALLAMAAMAYVTASRGFGMPFRGYGAAGAPEEKFIGVVYCTCQGSIHLMRGFQLMAPPSRGLYLPDYDYADFILLCPLIVLDILFTLKIPGKVVSAALTALSLFMAACAYATEAPYQWFLFALGLVFLIVLFARVQAGVRQRLSELPSAAVGAMYVAMVSFFGMWPLFPIVFLLGPRSANVLDRTSFAAIHVVFDIVCKGVLSLALLRVRAFMETIGWYGYSLTSKDIRERLISRLSDDAKAARPTSGGHAL
ncbi:hypothetical protein FNF27_00503 [Cafeteria roenbergensis]|uniref:Uncharacterized protein n=2 Tax=Cafeteria roenbergensis TaxID=33653 RepID=A0A5A8EJ97_CAFRO|nr:hypothetical protein FNF31_01884 [Cafeteria roenbergensis]KAA0177955.1 hypothetical protein FNF27_00503 [Cafeteria roenbergensis]